MKTFIRACEIWVPSRDRTMLEFHRGLYPGLESFRLASEKLCFGFDEGLPGKAWATRHAIILKDLQDSYFVRARSAKEAGLTCGVALPIFAGDYLLAVVAMYCGDDEQHVGAVELWHNDPAKSYDMSLVEGYYGTAEFFERVSRQSLFRPGFGLPGTVWKSGMPEIMADLWNAQRFLRRDDARKVGLSKGLGIPLLHDPKQHYVMAFLSAMSTPIARRFEVWVPDQMRESLILLSGDCSLVPDFAATLSDVRLAPGAGPLGRVWDTGLPEIAESLPATGAPNEASAQRAGLSNMLALPVLETGRLKAIVAMYF